MNINQEAETGAATLTLSRLETGSLCLRLSGDWLLKNDLPDANKVAEELNAQPVPSCLDFDCRAMANWDTGV
ncbi:MAG: hypothetical protein HN764_15200, partial [Gammaproteobacteria bacterium]|nr:hypothetical protein [Gammaproteobacteria bacterium]